MSIAVSPVTTEIPENNTVAPPADNPDPSPEIETATQTIGKSLLQEITRQEKRQTPLDFAYNQVLSVATADDKTKVELFRFTDALPALQDSRAVATHLREYLLDSGAKLPVPAPQALQILEKTHAGRELLAWASRFGASQMAARFIAGANAQEAASSVRRLRRQNMSFTLDLLGEAVISDAEAAHYQKQYLDVVAEMAKISGDWLNNDRTDTFINGARCKVNVSVKLSSLYARFDPMAWDETTDSVLKMLVPILKLAKENNVFVNYDMEQHDFCEITQHIFQKASLLPEFKEWEGLGFVSQAYLKRAEADLETMRDHAKARGVPYTVRLVKGAYWDYENILSAQRNWAIPVWEKKNLTDACYERCTRFLAQNYTHLKPAFATHNARSAAHALAVCEAAGVPKTDREFQVLYGMGEAIGRALAARGERVRVYVPFGELLPGMAYLVRRLLENTSNDSFIRRASGDGDAAALLASPA